MSVACKSRKSLIYLTVFSSLAALSCSVFGYLTLPLASGLYAAVLLTEKQGKRFASYILPVATFVLNFFINGIFSLEGGAYVALGVIIYFCYVKDRSKSETVFYVSLITFLLTVLSMVILPFEVSGVVTVSAIREFYRQIYLDLKTQFVSYITEIVGVGTLGESYFLFNVFEAEELFWQISILSLPTLMIFSFSLTGLSIKLFDFVRERQECSVERSNLWFFNPSTPTAVFYVILSLVSSVATGNDVVSLSIQILYYFFFLIYLYLGIKSVFRFVARRTGSKVALLIVLFSFLALSTAIMQIISYVGAFTSISNNKRKSNEQS